MQVYELLVKDRAITLLSDDKTLVRTSKGVDSIKLLFASDEWLDGFDLSVAFINGEVIEEVEITPTESVGLYLAEITVEVPDEVLEESNPLGVTVHGFDSDGNHIITKKAFPLDVETEGDEEGDAPSANPS